MGAGGKKEQAEHEGRKKEGRRGLVDELGQKMMKKRGVKEINVRWRVGGGEGIEEGNRSGERVGGIQNQTHSTQRETEEEKIVIITKQ